MEKAETAYRTITEVADLIQVQPSVLRFWEKQFHQIKPIKRVGRRYYTAEDVVLLARIRDLLYKEGFTIKGVQKKLKEKEPSIPTLFDASPVSEQDGEVPSSLRQELVSIRDSLKPYLE